ncbi:MAG: hypothetical protein KJZ75_14655 [Hyphomonadaceae bacterium]|nr:hypothetical protein [Hyphomonadaceae bacterium]
MLALTLNPGFVPIVAALIALAAPRTARPFVMGGAALVALWLLLENEFGAAAAMAQMGLPVVLLNLDALNRIFGIVMLILLVFIAVYSSGRRNRYEDAAILLLAGGAISALFVGDLVSFVASAALAGLAAAWIVFASPLENANRSGVRLLIWHGLEGLLFLVGVALHLTAGAASSIFARMDVASMSGACIFAALMIRIGAPFAHVWLKDAVSHASPAGGAALSSFTSIVGVYALARLFPVETLLVPIGVAMIVIGAVFAAIEDDLRRAGAYALTAQSGVCVALIGVGSPLALAAAEGHAFAALLAFAALQMALGGIVERTGSARLSDMKGVFRAMPMSSLVLLIAGLATAGAPLLALYATQTVALDAVAQWDLRWVWLAFAALPGVLFVALALRPALVAHQPLAKPRRFNEAPFPMLLGAGLAAFLSVSIGLAPRWLYDLMPASLSFAPYELERLAPRLELLGAAGVAYVLLYITKLAPKTLSERTLDIDALYRGPMADAGRWAGVLLLRAYGAWQATATASARSGGRLMARAALRCDRPFAPMRSSSVAQFLSIAAILMIILLFR